MVPGGYRWWYADGIADDGQRAFALILFIGSVFSPHYRRARRQGPAEPLEFCAVNLALYGAGRSHWVFSERSRGIEVSSDALSLGRTTAVWDRGRLVVDLDEKTAVFGRRVAGRIEIDPEHDGFTPLPLDGEGHHVWAPFAPRARFEARFSAPRLRLSGSAYLDGNSGDRALEDDFRRWQWSRADLGRGTAIVYDVEDRQGQTTRRGWWCDDLGRVEPLSAPQATRLRPTAWCLRRTTRVDSEQRAAWVRTLEDTPFYARSLIQTRLRGLAGLAIHETLDLCRFTHPLVQGMIPYRMRRELP